MAETDRAQKKQNLPIVVSRHYEAPPERVFDAWLDPARAGKFLFRTPEGEMTRVDIDARIGGKFNITEKRDGEDTEHVGEYLAIDRPRRLAFTFGVPKYSPAMTRVTIDIAPAGAGSDLTLTHEGVDPEWEEKTRKGWGKILEGLAGVLGE